MSGQIKSVAVVVAGRAMQALAALATIKLATSLMSPDQMGSVNQIMALSALLYSVWVMPVTYYVGRGLLDWHEAGLLARRFRGFVGYAATVAALCALAVFLFKPVLDIVPSVSASWVTLLVAMYILAFSVHTVVSNGLVILGRRAAYAVFINAAAWTGLAAAVWFFQRTGEPAMWLLGIYGGFVFSVCLYSVTTRFRLPRDSRPDTPVRDHVPFTYERIFAFAWPMAIVYALAWVQLQSYRFILEDLAGLASVGLFFAAHAICAAPMQMFQTMFNEFYSQTLYQKLKGSSQERQARAWNAYAEAYIPAVVLFGAFLAGCGPYLAKILLGPQFQIVASILVWPALIETLRAVSTSIDTMGIIKVDMRVNMVPAIAGAVCAPLLVYMLAGDSPLIGTGMALSLAGLIGLIVVIPISYRALPIRWPVRRIVLALVAGLPLVIAGNTVGQSGGAATWTETVIALATGAAYLVVMQYLFARKWLGNVPVPRED